MFEKKKRNKIKGCFKRSLIPSFLMIFCLLVSVITCFSVCKNTSGLSDYATLLKELSQKIDVSDVSENPLKAHDSEVMRQKVCNFVENKDGNALFDIAGGIIYENIKKENINFLEQSLSLDKRDLGAFLNSMIKAGWLNGYFENKKVKNFLKVIEIKSLTTEDVYQIEAVLEVDLNLIIDEKPESKSAQEAIDVIDGKFFVTYFCEFTKEEVKKTSMKFNTISAKSDKLLLQLLLGTIKEEEINSNLNSIMETLLRELEKINIEWGLNTSFENNCLVFKQP